jgi:hypothetical protein
MRCRLGLRGRRTLTAEAIESDLANMLFCSRDRIAVAMQQAANQVQGGDAFLIVVAVLGTRMTRPQERKLGLPEAQHVGFNANQPRGLTDLYLPVTAVAGDRGARSLTRGVGCGACSGDIDDFSPLPTRSFSTWLGLKDRTLRESIVIDAPV